MKSITKEDLSKAASLMGKKSAKKNNRESGYYRKIGKIGLDKRYKKRLTPIENG